MTLIVGKRTTKTHVLIEKLNSYHPNKKLTIKKIPTKLLDTKIIWRGREMKTSLQKFTISQKSFQWICPQKFLPDINVMP